MERFEEFTRNGKSFVYIDLSGFKTNDEFTAFIEAAKPLIRKYAEHSLHTITNIEGVRFDSRTKKINADWMTHNKPYVKYGVVIGVDSIKQIMVNAIFTLSGRTNMGFASTKEAAVEWLLSRK
jgi:hypothetical protein